MITAILAILLFALLIFPHELGHFIAARLLGVKVNEFAFGMGPALWRKQGKETLYSIRLFPIGGYNAMEGEDGESEDSKAFCNKPWWAKIIILVSGAAMNVIIAWLALTMMMTMIGFATNSIDSVVENSPAAEAGIQAGDQILAVNGKETEDVQEISKAIDGSEGKPLDITVEKDGRERTLSVTPKKEEDRYIIGITWGKEHDLLRAAGASVQGTVDLGRLMFQSFKMLLTGEVSGKDVAGPVGMVSLVHQTQAQGFSSFLWLVALISLNLAILNLLPFPALDGGRIVFVIIRAVTGKAITDKQEAMVHAAGMILLLVLVVLVTWNDIERLLG